ncbi:MAG: YczE/YyaS/YitT family protein [Clostridium sp.]|uniref:YczE/YyaS/YitT family protein n=1 Tax=Clostridium sp. TaxID=1506 RepID=UPI003D6D6E89
MKSINKNLSFKSVSISMLGIFIVCIGVSFNNNTQLGNDPIGIVYDGVRAFWGLSYLQLGYVSNFINIGLLLILYLFGRKYLNVGTFLYLIPYGVFISIGSHLYPHIFTSDALGIRLLAGGFGCLIYYIGISLFVASNIGVDPFNGFMLTIRDKTGWSISRSKITMDIVLTIIGFLLGGKFGIITIVTAITTGPAIQFFSGIFKKCIYHES